MSIRPQPSSPTAGDMEKLLKVGFRKVGHCFLDDGRLGMKLNEHAPHRNTLYAFVRDGVPVYVGKTTVTLATRMSHYLKPSPSQVTNVRNNADLVASLQDGREVEIFILPDEGLVRYGDFDLNLAAALEDSIIRVIQPAWNGGRKERPDTADDAAVAASPDVKAVDDGGGDIGVASGLSLAHGDELSAEFSLRLEQSYFDGGFFNVGVVNGHYFAGDGERLEIFLGRSPTPVIGLINRTANKTGAPRLMGYVATRNWLQANVGLRNQFLVRVYSPVSIGLSAIHPD